VDAVRRVTSRLLERLGYKVLQAADGAAALRLVSEHPAPIDLLLTDVVMPDLGGPELADKVRARRSEIKVLFMSGYTDGAIVHNGVLNAGIAYLQKPLTPATLATKVREVLGHSAGLDAGRRPSQS
jgi:CheY-like chemotaxis protein